VENINTPYGIYNINPKSMKSFRVIDDTNILCIMYYAVADVAAKRVSRTKMALAMAAMAKKMRT
jgi:hypothetical protein